MRLAPRPEAPSCRRRFFEAEVRILAVHAARSSPAANPAPHRGNCNRALQRKPSPRTSDGGIGRTRTTDVRQLLLADRNNLVLAHLCRFPTIIARLNATNRLSLSSGLLFRDFRPAFQHPQPSSPSVGPTLAGLLPFSYTPSPLLPTFPSLPDQSIDLDLIASPSPRELSRLGFDHRCSNLACHHSVPALSPTLTANDIEALDSGTH
jgi:hypothetical protein